MGYELKFIIGLKSESKEKIKGKFYNYTQVISIYNYCVDYNLADYIQENGRDSGCEVFIENGNEPEIVDRYGKPLQEIDLDILLKYFDKVDDYRRFKPLKMMLQGFLENKELFDSDFTKLVVLTYGY